MDELKILDEVAYVRFASVYREFKDVSTFMDELKDIKNKSDMEEAKVFASPFFKRESDLL